jgi:precorrin-2 dehydrogenase/sirohydrochlorin ferrochelatase
MALAGPSYPVNLVLTGRRCLVVGGGAVAARKIEGLLDAGAVVHVVAPEIDPSIQALGAEGRSVTFDPRPYRSGDVEGYWLAITATNDPATNRQVYEDGEARHTWVNSADDPAHCHFTLPSLIRQGSLLVTFSTGGHSPAVATWLRRRFATEFGPEYVTLIDLLASERERIRANGRSTEGLDWQGALDSGMLDLIREGDLAEAKERLQACLSSSSD